MAAVGALAALLLAVTTETAAAAPTWHQQGPPGRRPLNDVSAPDDAHAWAVGQGGQILATADGGDSWVAQDDPSINTNNLFGVDIVDAQHGWAVGLRGTIIATTDGGAHWTGQDSGTTETLRAVDFVSSQQGWAVGAGGRILTTDDGGAEWTLQAAGAVSEGPLTDVSFADAQHGWAVGFQPARILATTDGGEHWAVQSAPGINAQGVAAVDDLHAWAVGVSGKILATTDGGTTWAEQESGVTSQLEEVSFVDAQHGWAVGAGGTVLATEDGGATWAVTNLPGAEKLTGVDFPDATHGIVVGEGQPVFNYYEPGPVAGFEVTAPSSTTAGQAIDFSVTARDASGHVATGFTGEVEFFTMGPDDTLPPKSTLTEGTGQFTAVLREAGAAVIGVRSPGVNNGFSDPIEVKPAAATHFLLVGVPGAKSAGGSIQFGVTARDEFENTVTNFVRTINITTTDPQATATVTPVLIQGGGEGFVIFRTSGEQTFTISDGTISTTSRIVVVNPGPTAALRLTAPTAATAGEPFDFGVEALDAFGNLTPAYAGTVHFASSDPGAILPADSTLEDGAGTFQAALLKGGNQTLTAEDAAAGLTATAGPIAVGRVAPTLSVLASGGVTLGGAVGASATLGGLDPSGNLEFALYGPEDPTCAGSPAYTASVAVSGAGTYEAPAFTPTAIGTYRWVVTYPGDGANLDAATACADPDAAVTVSAPPVQPEERKPEGPEAKKPEQHTAPPSPAPTPQVVIWHTPNSGHAPKGGGGKGDPRYTFIFTDPTGPVTFYCRLDGKPWKVCASPAVYRNLRRGKHVFRVKSVDAAGAQSAVQTVRFRAGRRPIR